MNTENKKVLLQNLVRIRSGIYRKSAPEGKVYQIQKGNFDEGGAFLPLPKLPELSMESGLDKYFLCGNEILLTAKGNANTAFLYPEMLQDAVASSVFLVLTVKNNKVSPIYLTWYLNTSSCQRKLSQLSRGSGVHSLAKRDLQQLTIPLPPLPIQQSILGLRELQQQEQRLYKQIIIEKSRLAEAQLLQLTGSAFLPSSAPASAPLKSLS